MEQFPRSLDRKLQKRIEENMLRKLPAAHSLADFSSNDYLGFSRRGDISQRALSLLEDYGIAGNGATGSRLITGNHPLYGEAENAIASFHKAGAALIFNSGYDANVGLFSSVPQKGDIVLYDEYIHASIRDGLRLSNATSYKFRHNDTEAIEKLLEKYSSWDKEIYVVTESVFSMDGDTPDLATMCRLCSRFNARLVADEAHAIGVTGGGGGLVQELGLQEQVFARVVTFGKALGCHGAAVLGHTKLRHYLVNFARSFIYTTGLPPHAIATVLAAYNQLAGDVSAQNELREIICFFSSEAERLGLGCFINSASAIHCAVVPGTIKVKAISMALQERGFDVRAILSPTVPAGQERLRFCLHSYNTKQQVTTVLTHFRELLHQ